MGETRWSNQRIKTRWSNLPSRAHTPARPSPSSSPHAPRVPIVTRTRAPVTLLHSRAHARARARTRTRAHAHPNPSSTHAPHVRLTPASIILPSLDGTLLLLTSTAFCLILTSIAFLTGVPCSTDSAPQGLAPFTRRRSLFSVPLFEHPLPSVCLFSSTLYLVGAFSDPNRSFAGIDYPPAFRFDPAARRRPSPFDQYRF